MRLLPLLTAILVTASLYLVVFERDRLLAFATGEAPQADQADAPADADDAATAAPDDTAPVSVRVLKSRARSVDGAVLLRGQTEAARQVEVRAETGGKVMTDPLRAGAEVAAGTLLCQIDPGNRPAVLAEAEARLPEAEARLAEARARLAEAAIAANAATRLSEGGFASDTRVAGADTQQVAARAGLASAEAALRAAEAGVAAVRLDLERTKITAPFAGHLETDAAETGALLSPGGLCATIVALDRVKIVGFVAEVDVGRIETGALAGARLVTGREVTGRVTFLSRSADPDTRTFRVEIELANPDLALRDGQTAEILIAAEGAPAHLLPASALTLDDRGRLGVRLAVDGRAAFAPVELLRDSTEGVWVAGLPDAAEVIVTGQEYVTDDVLLAVHYTDAAP